MCRTAGTWLTLSCADEQYEAVRHIEKVYYPETYRLLTTSADEAIRTYWSQPCRMTNLVTLEWGKGAGKDHICRVGSLRIAYLLLCLPNPQAYYGMPSQDTIHLLNVASSAPQASRAFFAPMRRVVSRPGNWFENLGVEVVEVRNPRDRARARQQPGVKALQDEIRFAHSISAVSGHSDADSQEGLNLLAGFMDEVDAFKSRAELAKLRGNQLRESSTSAESVLAMLQTSASTRFPEIYKVVRISYPRYLGSTIQQLGARGRADIAERGESSRHYVSGPKSTWEVNPRVPGKYVFAEDYREDPVMAAAKYECRPSRAVNPVLRQHGGGGGVPGGASGAAAAGLLRAGQGRLEASLRLRRPPVPGARRRLRDARGHGDQPGPGRDRDGARGPLGGGLCGRA